MYSRNNGGHASNFVHQGGERQCGTKFFVGQPLPLTVQSKVDTLATTP